MRLFRRAVKKDGDILKTKNWYADVRIKGRRYNIPLFDSEELSKTFADRLDVLIGEYEAGTGYGKANQLWLNQLTPSMTDRLHKIGLLDSSRAASKSDLQQHLDDWRDALVAGGTGAKHADQNHHRACRIFTEAGFKSLSNVKPNEVMTVIGRLQTIVYRRNHTTDKIEQVETGKASPFSKLHHLRAVKQFSKWAFVHHRTHDDPLMHLTVKNVRVENQRRSLSADEVSYLLEYVGTAPDVYTMTGRERALIYELACTTGLRRDEIKSLKRISFDFERLTVQVKADDTKNRKVATLPLQGGLAGKIKAHLAGKMPTAPAFNVNEAMAKALKRDMTAARRQWIQSVKDNSEEYLTRTNSDFLKVETYEGKADFHSLRHSFGTWLASAGVHPKQAMDLMRHSDINLTMALYTHSDTGAAAAAVDKLPALGNEPKRKQVKA